MKEILEFAKLGNTKKIVLMISSLDLILVIFMDYLFAVNMGINVQEMFLTSFHSFAINLFTPQSFTLIIGFVLLCFFYYLAIPLMFPIILYRFIEFISSTILIIIYLPSKLYCKIKGTELKLDFSLKSGLEYYKMIKIDDNGNIYPNKRTNIFLEIYNAYQWRLIEDFYVNAFKITSIVSIISIVLYCNFWVILISSLLSLIH